MKEGLGIVLPLLAEFLLDFAVEVADEAASLNDPEFFELARGVDFGHLRGNRARVLEDFAFVKFEEGIKTFSPILHGHRDAAFGAFLGEFEVGVDEATEGLEFVF